MDYDSLVPNPQYNCAVLTPVPRVPPGTSLFDGAVPLSAEQGGGGLRSRIPASLNAGETGTGFLYDPSDIRVQ